MLSRGWSRVPWMGCWSGAELLSELRGWSEIGVGGRSGDSPRVTTPSMCQDLDLLKKSIRLQGDIIGVVVLVVLSETKVASNWPSPWKTYILCLDTCRYINCLNFSTTRESTKPYSNVVPVPNAPQWQTKKHSR